ncbi:hypothetical protein HYX13_05340 [Candidatus Woesearchaeota archaeon]|nr:hypothetical protein [Candidatus Woesearchaeota archaeon]
MIQKNKTYFYYGTNTHEFSVRQQGGFYEQKEKVLLVNPLLHYALYQGIYSCRLGKKNTPKKSLLFALPMETYWDQLKVTFLASGKDAAARYELHGKLALEDLLIVDSLEKLQEVSPTVTRREMKKFVTYYL